MIVVSFLMLYPVLWLVASSFKPNGDIFSTATSLFPENFTLEHYINGWKGFGGYTFTTFFSNSLLVALLSAVGMMASSALVAFGLARIKFKGRNIWFVLMVVTMMLPGQVMMIPRFVLFNSMGWVGTHLPMIVPSLRTPARVHLPLIPQFIRGIPRDMDEAAKIDGCSWYGVFFSIICPHDRAFLVTVAVLTFMSSWRISWGALLYLEQTGNLHRRICAEDVQRQLHVGLRRYLCHVRSIAGADIGPLLLLPEKSGGRHLHPRPERLILINDRQGGTFYALY